MSQAQTITVARLALPAMVLGALLRRAISMPDFAAAAATQAAGHALCRARCAAIDQRPCFEMRDRRSEDLQQITGTCDCVIEAEAVIAAFLNATGVAQALAQQVARALAIAVRHTLTKDRVHA